MSGTALSPRDDSADIKYAVHVPLHRPSVRTLTLEGLASSGSGSENSEPDTAPLSPHTSESDESIIGMVASELPGDSRPSYALCS
jgi:hypothetical protein